uniref:Uncharacterized protein n=1 Tax=Candidatus Kentrum eta TaxID=2126337 RepID=A0A450USW7_9GAMM|nr:MAG: hypothetical protein BECKH772A_GA0070896_1000169 [Candidatus Kentron sp. H]VFJ88320.1 MAG: hypothetical protein BECKH772B_GA0070898_1000161 [Candidatus Kentron sp. H]VFJ95550.1 MAG: hypothetical protein BECKH772C_GA0070978_1000269 [Candidatus Kentron sp. H]
MVNITRYAGDIVGYIIDITRDADDITRYASNILRTLRAMRIMCPWSLVIDSEFDTSSGESLSELRTLCDKKNTLRTTECMEKNAENPLFGHALSAAHAKCLRLQSP